MKKRIIITGSGTISSLGTGQADNWFSGESAMVKRKARKGEDFWAAPLNDIAETQLKVLKEESPVYSRLDRSALMAIYASRRACTQAGWEKGSDFGINIASSRGTTELLELYHDTFTEHPQARLASMASPATTAGNISSWVGQDLEAMGIIFSHSITCSSSLHAIANAMAWIGSGMSQRFLAGGAEAPLTPFTVAQMRGLRIYAGDHWNEFPCRPFNGLHNSMVLGEGAAVFCLEEETASNSDKGLALIAGLGYASEKVLRAGAISEEGLCLQQSMKMAMAQFGAAPDLVLAHAPGTIQGDAAELNAIKAAYANELPRIYSSKWQTGHTLGASGTLNMNLALAILESGKVPVMPFDDRSPVPGKSIRSIMINAVGFGGNAVSVILTRTN